MTELANKLRAASPKPPQQQGPSSSRKLNIQGGSRRKQKSKNKNKNKKKPKNALYFKTAKKQKQKLRN